MHRHAIRAAVLALIVILIPVLSLAGPLPDTGQTKCYNNTEEIPCPQPGEPFYGQDGNYLINPPSYTKLDTNGNDLPDDAASWAMVRDNVTGLIWENKTDDGSIHDKDNTYTWDDAQTVFIAGLNSANYGGQTDWRLPTPTELASIVDRGLVSPSINTAWFPNTVSAYYWSSSSYENTYAWGVRFDYGFVQGITGSCYVRAVRSGQTRSSDTLIINGDNTVTDTATGLMWQQGNPGTKTWEQALTYCENLTLSGYSDWRLPTAIELQSIVDYTCANPSIDVTAFPETTAGCYWSSTFAPSDIDFAWRVQFIDGGVNTAVMFNNYYVRAVRGGQPRLLGHLVIQALAQGGFWDISSQQTITWDTAGLGGDVAISLSRDGGKTFETISASTPNDGSFDWTVTGPESVNCALKIEPLVDPSKSSVQSLFTIYIGPNDTDVDGLPDVWEQASFGDLDQIGAGDPDNDGLTNLQEYNAGTNPMAVDTDGDGLTDDWELSHGLNPANADTDGDGMPDGWEVVHGLNPLADDTGADPDGDKFTNAREYQDGTDPNNATSHFILPVATGRLPDTGQTKCYDNTQEIPCPQEGQAFYGQDGNYLINPPQYIKMDDQGRYLAGNATTWAMIYDVNTGLIWENKTDDGSIHDKDNTYNWNDAQSVFMAGLNSANFGGHSDWRMPTPKELASIVDRSRFSPAINTAWFANTQATAYWSSSSSAGGIGLAWGVSFNHGVVNSYDKSVVFYVRAVRSGQSRSLGHLIINGDGTVTDTATGLMWQGSDSQQRTWEQALAYCETLTLAGHKDWRLPNATEMQSIVDYNRFSPGIDPAAFPGTAASAYWSSSSYASGSNGAWGVGFSYGNVWNYNKSDSYYVRAVRSGQSRSLGLLMILTPDQGGFWHNGSNQTITWDPAAIAGDVSISLSRDGGKTYETIVANTPNDGSFDWTVTGPTSVNCALKIEPLADPTKATVQSLFTIGAFAPSNLQATPAHDTWTNDNTIQVTWTAADDYGAGVAGYSYVWDTSPTTDPDISVDTVELSALSFELSDGASHYFHIRAVDSAGVAGETIHLGPFKIDTTAPTVWSTPAAGSFNTPIAVTLGSNDPNAEIYWSNYPTNPVTTGTYYLGDPLNIFQTTRILFYAKDTLGNASAVQDVRFTIDVIPPAAPTVPETNPQAGDDPTPTFSWNAVADAHHYLFQWATIVDFSNATTVQVAGATTYTKSPALTQGGRYYWRVAAVDAAGNQGNWSSSPPYDYIAASMVRKAVVVAGSGPTVSGGSLWPSFVACADFAYSVLTHRGYWPERIAYLSHQTTAQNPNVDQAATNANLQTALNWAADADELVVYLVGHGMPSLFVMGGSENLGDTTLDGWLDAIQAARPTMKLILVYDACHAGSFLAGLRRTGTQERVVIFGADADQASLFSSEGNVSFSWWFWSHIDLGHDIKLSFDETYNALCYSFNDNQTALLDADGLYPSYPAEDNKSDPALVRGRYIGFNTAPAGAPVIGSVVADICLTGSSSLLVANGVTGSTSLQRVWATITRPDAVLNDPDNPTPNLPEVDLIPTGGGTYEGTYANFDIPGAYTVTILAMNVQGLLSSPGRTVVVKNPVKGDLDHNGAADLADAIIAAKAISGTPTGRTSPCEDVNGDGKAGMAELLHALQKVAGIR